MASTKVDVVIEAVHQKSGRELTWVRAYERRGPTYSDHVLLSRQELIERLKRGKKVVVGQRLPNLASTFSISHPVRLAGDPGDEIVLAGKAEVSHDFLEDVPFI